MRRLVPMSPSIIPLLLVMIAACSRPEYPAQPVQPESPTAHQGTTMTEGDLHYVAETAIRESFPVQLATTVTAANIGRRPAAIEFTDGCPVLLRAYRTPDRTGAPAWDQAHDTFCTMAIQNFTINPGESRRFTTQADAREILGDSLPNGRYYLTAVLRKSGGALELAAGEAGLAR